MSEERIERFEQEITAAVGSLWCDGRTCLVTKDVAGVSIGRGSEAGDEVDFDVGQHSFVSRQHLKIHFQSIDNTLELTCLGKNGVFIDHLFRPHSVTPYHLPPRCTLRFPSTNVEVMVRQFIGRTLDKDMENVIENKSRIRKNDVWFEQDTELSLARFGDKDHCQLSNFDLKKEIKPLGDMYGHCQMRRVKMEPVEKVIDQSLSIPKMIINRSYSCTTDFLYGHNSQIYGTSLDSKDLAIDYGSETQKPPYSYAQLIVQAVSTCPHRQLTLNGIYNYISKHYPYFKSHDKGWQNSVRHNLSLNRYFIKVPRAQDEPGKGSFWRVDTAYETKLISQAFRKRRLRATNTCLTSDNSCHGPSVYSGSRTNNLCSFSDNNTKLGTFYAVKTNDQKTTFLLKKMNDTKTVSQKIISVMNHSNHSMNTEKKISVITPNNVFHNQQTQRTLIRTGQKRLYHSSVHVIKDTSMSSSTTCGDTLFNIDGNLYSTQNDLKSIHVLSTASKNTSIPFIPLIKPQSTNNKYILISTSKTKHMSSPLHSSSSVSITGSGSLYRSMTTGQMNLKDSNDENDTYCQSDIVSFKPRKYSPSPLSQSSEHFLHDNPSHSSSDMVPPLSPNLKYTHSIDRDDELEDDLDFEMDQFLVSSPIMDNSGGDLDTSPDLYNVDNDNDDVMWQDSLVFHDVEIEGH